MKPKASWLLFIASFAVLCLAGWTSYAQRQNPSTNSRVVWEYKTLHGSRALREAQLNDMGAYGWELIGFDDGERGNGSFEGTYYFKRPK
jgi:hypothetical protein